MISSISVNKTLQSFVHCLIALSCLISLGAANRAFAFSIEPVAGVNFIRESITPPSSVTDRGADMGYSLGALITLPILPFFELETGLLYSAEKPSLFMITNSSLSNTFTKTYFKFPFVLQFNVLNFVTFGAGAFVGLAQGDLTYSNKIVPGVTDAGTMSYEAAQLSKTNYGLLLSAGIQYPILPLTRLLFKGYYEIGAANLTTVSGSTSQSSGLHLLAGLSFGL